VVILDARSWIIILGVNFGETLDTESLIGYHHLGRDGSLDYCIFSVLLYILYITDLNPRIQESKNLKKNGHIYHCEV
jgi:hypothetical protein